MARRGPKRQLEVESAFWRLLGEGVGPVDAAARVGIGRKTGYRWRAETGGVAPAVLAEEARTARYLSRLERHRVASLRRDGVGVREVARQLGRAASTISRELKRNTAAPGPGARAPRGWPRTPSSRRWCAPSWSWSGARSRSPPTCARCSRAGRPGTCATRASTRVYTAGRLVSHAP